MVTWKKEAVDAKGVPEAVVKDPEQASDLKRESDMNIILFEPQEFTATANLIHLTDRRHHHIRQVLRAKNGDELRVGQVNGLMGYAKVEHTTVSETVLRVELGTPPPPPLPIRLILALPRPKVLRRVVECIATMGVKEIVLVGCWKVEKSYWQSPFLTAENLKAQMILGLEQAKDTMLPTLTLKPLFRPFIEDELAQFSHNSRQLIAHPTEAPLIQRGPQEAMTLAIGPDGGFTPYEVEAFIRAGFEPFSMGQRILRVEQAVPALLGKIG